MPEKRRKWLLWLVLSILSLALGGRAQQAPPTVDLLRAPKSNLVDVHWPDLTKLEPDVREQLAPLQATLAMTVKNPKSTDALLSEAFGTMGEIYQAYSLNSPARECYFNPSRLAPQDFRWIYLLGRLDQQDDLTDHPIAHYQHA